MVRRFFRFEELGTNYRRETVAGLTTFVTMAYIVVVNPNILHEAVDADIIEQATGSTDPAYLPGACGCSRPSPWPSSSSTRTD